jgi:hypothetical protein
MHPMFVACGRAALFTVLLSTSLACGTAAQQSGVGRACAGDDDCADDQRCLDFAGGYCGLQDCTADDDCPDGSACVAHTDGENYCFLVCLDKPECNGGRDAAEESNCSSNITFVDAQDDNIKACVPPSSG